MVEIRIGYFILVENILYCRNNTLLGGLHQKTQRLELDFRLLIEIYLLEVYQS